MSQRSS